MNLCYLGSSDYTVCIMQNVGLQTYWLCVLVVNVATVNNWWTTEDRKLVRQHILQLFLFSHCYYKNITMLQSVFFSGPHLYIISIIQTPIEITHDIQCKTGERKKMPLNFLWNSHNYQFMKPTILEYETNKRAVQGLGRIKSELR